MDDIPPDSVYPDRTLSSIGSHSRGSPVGDWRADGLLYHKLNHYYRKQFGTRTWKLTLDAGCGCPNRDGTLATLGCIFCDPQSFSPSRRGGKGDRSNFPERPKGCFAETGPAPFSAPIAQQVEDGIRQLTRRCGARRFIAYFQPGTNTYGPIDRLRSAYCEAIAHPDVVGLAVGTRPDCVAEPILDLLAELAGQTWVVVEYGLQTVHDRTLDRINRGHHYDAFLDAYRRTRRRQLDVGVHVILGLPGESRDDMLATARELAKLEIHSIKLHNLYAVRKTALAEQVAAAQVRLPELQDYVAWAVDFLEQIPASVVIDRICGDAQPEYLVGPSWCLNKPAVQSAIEAEFRRRGSVQGSRQ